MTSTYRLTSPAFHATRATHVINVFALGFGLLFAAQTALKATTNTKELFSTTFVHTDADLSHYGWTAAYDRGSGSGAWQFVEKNAYLTNPFLLFRPSGSLSASLTKTISAADSDFSNKALSLTFNAGWLVNGPNDSTTGFRVALLDDNGNGYLFVNRHTTSPNNSTGWKKITDGDPYAAQSTFTLSQLDTTQVKTNDNASIVDGVNTGFPTFTISRSALGLWSFSGEQWPVPLTFSDSTYSTFTKVVIYVMSDYSNSGGFILNNITLTATSIPEPETTAFVVSLGAFGLAAWRLRHRRG